MRKHRDFFKDERLTGWFRLEAREENLSKQKMA